MEKKIRDRFNDSILQEAAQRYGIASGQLRLLDGFESFIYEFERGPHAYILRIGHSLRRSEALIAGEVDWINYLAEGGVSVARAIRSETGKLVEAVSDGAGAYFLAAAFVKAQGQPPRWADWTPARFEQYGKLLGSLHARTKDYQPADPAWKRMDWDDASMQFAELFLPASEAAVKEKYRALLQHLRALPKESGSYGLIHQDAHGGNFFVDEAGGFTLFDFDDCVYSWFINDIAIVLFYMTTNTDDEAAATRAFMPHFLRGYRQTCRLDPKWLKEIPYFLKLREMDLYAVIHRDFDVNNIDDPWCERYMRGRKSRIDNDVPTIDFDFETLSEYC